MSIGRPPFSLALFVSALGHLLALAWVGSLPPERPAQQPAPLDAAWIDLAAMPGVGGDPLAGMPGGGGGGDPGLAAPEESLGEGGGASSVLLTAEEIEQALRETVPSEDAAVEAQGQVAIDPVPGVGPTALRVDARRAPAPAGEALERGERARREAIRRLLVEQLASGGSGTGAGVEGGLGGGGGGGGYWGGGMVGGRAPDAAMVRWLLRVHTALQQHFHPLPVTLAEVPGAEAEIVMHIDVETGELLRVEVLKSSGSRSFDAAGVAAIERTGLLPPPPVAWQAALEGGLLVRFQAREVEVGSKRLPGTAQ